MELLDLIKKHPKMLKICILDLHLRSEFVYFIENFNMNHFRQFFAVKIILQTF